MKAIIRLRILFLYLVLSALVACNENGSVVSEYGAETNLNPAPNLTEDRDNIVDMGATLMATLAADALGAWQGGLLCTAVSAPLGPLAPVGGVVGGIVCGGGASYATGYALSGGGSSNGGGTGGGNQGNGSNGSGNQGGNNGNSWSDGGYTGPGAPAGGGGRGNGAGRKPIVGANSPYNRGRIFSNIDAVGYLHNALLVHLDANMPAFDTIDIAVLTSMYNLSKDFILNCGYFNASDVNNCFISLMDYVSTVLPFFYVRDLDDVIGIAGQVNTSDVDQNTIRNSIIEALNVARDVPPDYLYYSHYFQMMETDIVASLNLSQSIQNENFSINNSTTAMLYGKLASLSVAKYSYALWYKYMYLQDE